VRRYWRVYRTFFLTSFVRETEFRANFFAKVGQNVIWMCFFVLIILVIYGNTDKVAGWGKGDALILGATCFLMNSVTMALFFSLTEIPQHVRQGTLDFIITKPIDTQFWISSRRFNFDQIGTLLCGFVFVFVGTYLAKLHPTVGQWGAYLLLLVASMVIFYSFLLALMTTGIWLVRVDNLWVLGESVMQIARYPLDIYQSGLQRLFTYMVPLAFIATIPARQLVVGLDPTMVALGVGWAGFALAASRWFWRFALTHYTSASS
jgi:ABC-2 type transport system permease protein